MAGVQLKRGPNRWVVLHSQRDPLPVAERFAATVPEALDVVVTPIEGAFSEPSLAVRSSLQPVPPEPRKARPFLVEFTGAGGIIVWPGSTGADPMLALDAVLVPPAPPPGAPAPPASPGPVLQPGAQPEPPGEPEGHGNAAAVQIAIAAAALGGLWWLLSRR